MGPQPASVSDRVSSRSDIDKHFTPSYDPAKDVHVPVVSDHSGATDSAGVEDDWTLALRALRDRQQARGPKVLQFSGASVMMTGERDLRDEHDVKWAKRGEKREWDRGKNVD